MHSSVSDVSLGGLPSCTKGLAFCQCTALAECNKNDPYGPCPDNKELCEKTSECHWDDNFRFTVTETYTYSQSTCSGALDQGPSPHYEICEYHVDNKKVTCHGGWGGGNCALQMGDETI